MYLSKLTNLARIFSSNKNNKSLIFFFSLKAFQTKTRRNATYFFLVFHLLLSIGIFPGCFNENANKTSAYTSNLISDDILPVVELDTDSLIKIPLAKGSSQSTPKWDVVDTEGTLCFIQWDSQSSKLEFYDFYKGSIIKQVFIENKGEYAINAVDFFITDSIIIFIGVEYLYIMDLNGNLISTIKLLYSGNPKENSPGNQIGTETIWLRMKSNFVSNSHYINEDENKIYFPIQRRNGFLNHQKSFKEESIIAEVNLNDKKIRYLDIFFPTEMDKFRFLGNDDAGVEYITPYISVDARNKRLFYTFPANSTIFSYTLGHKNSLKSFKINSSYTANSISIDKTSFNELSGVNKLLCNNPGFGAITYDPYRNLYYRIHRGSDDECKSLPFYITLINSEFEKIAEFKLNDKWHPRSYAVLPEGIYFKHKKINSLDTIYLSRVNIDNYINVKK